MSRWNKDRIKILKELWQTHTSAEIAKILGEDFTRNSIIGKINRLGLSKKGSSNANMAAARKISNCQSFVSLIKREDLPSKVANAHKGRNICEWPFGHPSNSDFHFCGKSSYKKFPYCRAHYLEAYKHKKSISSIE